MRTRLMTLYRIQTAVVGDDLARCRHQLCPPILANPSLTKTINGREYDIYVDGDRVKMIAWHRGDTDEGILR